MSQLEQIKRRRTTILTPALICQLHLHIGLLEQPPVTSIDCCVSRDTGVDFPQSWSGSIPLRPPLSFSRPPKKKSSWGIWVALSLFDDHNTHAWFVFVRYVFRLLYQLVQLARA